MHQCEVRSSRQTIRPQTFQSIFKVEELEKSLVRLKTTRTRCSYVVYFIPNHCDSDVSVKLSTLLRTLHHIFDQQCTMPGDVVDPRWVRSQLSIHQPTPNHPFTIISFIHAHANSSIITLIITVNYIFIHCVCYSLILQRLYYIYIYPHGRRGRTTAVHVAVSG